MHSGDVLEKGTVILQLHHRKIRNRVLPVAVDFDRQIGEPRCIPGKGWAVPCDVVGLGNCNGQEVEIAFEKDEMVRPLLRMLLPQDGSYLRNGTIKGCWELTGNNNSLLLSLPRAKVESEVLPISVPAVVNVFVLDREKEIPLTLLAAIPALNCRR
ncbi:unnamed protein product [Angiostrongylus costaricensis]|uniref:GTP_EFTU_D3 domain-containing protein n=1 Tax=Angiostrongylus costaricensis TaxID=334426 RepID=A0A0R3PRW2_ANGCS|nr:unnamed protein product [Angiostrongylus costaricensis]